ncbi:hypothetical protein [Kitasatospora sp. NPDC090091]|uniref:hypothetical protein n=1 Tax=Kitasatospora sp. NPDC090091 TaxID=3364081 RepID=UPI003802836E
MADGGTADGEWWRKRGPWSAPTGDGAGAGTGAGDSAGAGGGAGAGAASADEDSVYAVEPSAGSPGIPPRPSEPPRSGPSGSGSSGPSGPSGPGGQAGPVRRPAARTADGGPRWEAQLSPDTGADEDVLPPSFMAAHADGWDFVEIDFSDGSGRPVTPVPEQRSSPEDAPAQQPAAAEAPTKLRGRKARARAKEQAGAAPPAPGTAPPAQAAKPGRPSALAGRRPSPLLLLAAVVLVGGAVTSQLLVMLVGWALGWMSRQLSDLTRKFAILGIPLATMSGTTLWYWGRAQGRWGAALQPGQQAGQAVWTAAPGVLRLAAVLSALFLLAVALKRRAQPEG